MTQDFGSNRDDIRRLVTEAMENSERARADTEGRLTYGHISFQFMCDECGKPRSRGKHERCSKARQARFQEKGL